MVQSEKSTDQANHISVLQETTLRRFWHNEDGWFPLRCHAIEALTDSAVPRQFIKKMLSRDSAPDANWGSTHTSLAVLAPIGKKRETNCINTEALFRIIPSIPSPKVDAT